MGRSFRTDDRGISPIIATIILVAITVTAAGAIAIYVAGLYVPYATVKLTVDEDGVIVDRDPSVTDNYYNGTMLLSWTVKSDDIDDVEEPGKELYVTVFHPVYGWSVTASLSGGTTGEADYGGEVSQENAVATGGTAIDNAGNDLGAIISWKIWAQTTSGGEIDEGMMLRVKLWFIDPLVVWPNHCWNKGDRIDYDIVGKGDAISGDVYSLYTQVIDP